ncbi:unnamed protein product [Fraxinus pennsylvanica]|uniref:Uncharacterized protein n=1 Tax=Fraxinus pennsylvanica TaxID=56036 RepID=A0AAD2AES5_9LAMI|nr:unnamed protein product [Fraxinus pennsylvanica]
MSQSHSPIKRSRCRFGSSEPDICTRTKSTLPLPLPQFVENLPHFFIFFAAKKKKPHFLPPFSLSLLSLSGKSSSFCRFKPLGVQFSAIFFIYSHLDTQGKVLGLRRCQRKIDLANSDSKNYGSQISDRVLGQGSYALHASHGSNFDQATVRPSFSNSQYQSELPNLNGYMCGDQVHQTRLSEANSLATDSDQHHLITTRGLSIHEFQKADEFSAIKHAAIFAASTIWAQ